MPSNRRRDKRRLKARKERQVERVMWLKYATTCVTLGLVTEQEVEKLTKRQMQKLLAPLPPEKVLRAMFPDAKFLQAPAAT